MNKHMDDGWLQDYLEGLLDPEAEETVRAHLEGCPRCQDEVEELSRLMTDLRALPLEALPSRDLWPQVAWRTQDRPEVEAHAIRPGDTDETESRQGHLRELEALPGLAVSEKPTRRSRRISLPAWQLLAASIALIVISGGSVWAILAGRPASIDFFEAGGGSLAQMVGWEEAYGEYDQAVSDLESVLEKGREVLDPETVRVLEENLRSIDRAIQEAENALMNDPASPLLQRYVADNLRKKVDLLRRAAGAVYAST
jgi:hypothetical protein